MTIYRNDNVTSPGKTVNLVNQIENGNEVYFVKNTEDFDPMIFANRVVNLEKSSELCYNNQVYSMKLNNINSSVIYVISSKEDCYEMMPVRPVGMITVSKKLENSTQEEKLHDNEIHPLYDEVVSNIPKMANFDHDNISLPETYYVMSDSDENKNMKNHQLEIITIDSDSSVYNTYNKKRVKKKKKNLAKTAAENFQTNELSSIPENTSKLDNISLIGSYEKIDQTYEHVNYKTNDFEDKKTMKICLEESFESTVDMKTTKQKKKQLKKKVSDLDSGTEKQLQDIESKQENHEEELSRKKNKSRKLTHMTEEVCLEKKKQKKGKKEKYTNFEECISNDKLDSADDKSVKMEETDAETLSQFSPKIYCDLSDLHCNESKNLKSTITPSEESVNETIIKLAHKAENSVTEEFRSCDNKNKKKKKAEKDKVVSLESSDKRKKSKKSKKIKDDEKDVFDVSLPEIECLLSHLFKEKPEKARKKNKKSERNASKRNEEIIKTENLVTKEDNTPSHSDFSTENTKAKKNKKSQATENFPVKKSKKSKCKDEEHSGSSFLVVDDLLSNSFSEENKKKKKSSKEKLQNKYEKSDDPYEFNAYVSDSSFSDSKRARKRKLKMMASSVVDLCAEDHFNISKEEKRNGDISQFDSDSKEVLNSFLNINEVELIPPKKKKKKSISNCSMNDSALDTTAFEESDGSLQMKTKKKNKRTEFL